MITITEDIRVRPLIPTSFVEVSFECPFCGVKLLVFVMLFTCKHCNEQLIDIITLAKSSDYALKYHFNEIDDNGASNLI